MPVTLTIKQVPERLAEKLRARAASRQRSLQGELMIILTEAVSEMPAAAQPDAVYQIKRPRKKPSAHGRRLTLRELWDRSRQLGSKSSSESAAIIRALRDERYRR
jgi:plasmid stability protein